MNNPPKAKSLSREVNLRCQEAPLRFGQRPCVAVPCDRDQTRPIDGRQVSPTASLLHVWKGQPDNSCLESTFPPIIVPYKFVSACKGWTNLLFWLWYSAFRFQNVRLGLQEAQIQPAWKYNYQANWKRSLLCQSLWAPRLKNISWSSLCFKIRVIFQDITIKNFNEEEDPWRLSVLNHGVSCVHVNLKITQVI